MDEYTLMKSQIFDTPIRYKNLKIYPVTMKDYLEFHQFVQCFLLEKNSTSDINIIQMTYLDYLVYLLRDGKPYLIMFTELLKIVLKIDYMNYIKDEFYETNNISDYYMKILKEKYKCSDRMFDLLKESIEINSEKNVFSILNNLNKNNPIIKYYVENGKSIFVIDGNKYTSSDFEEIRKIICSQNEIELPNENIDIELRKAEKEAERLRFQINKNKIGTLEDQIICIFISGIPLETIYKMTIRKFSKTLQRIDHKLHYQIYKSGEMSGMVKFKKPIEHWMANLDRDKFEDSKVNLEDMKKKLNGNLQI